ncbi:MAG: insulinase family protein [Clostridia bacterium]|nr:insulinase family protein [Clostridia bacterium]
MLTNKKESRKLREHYYKCRHKSGLDVYVFPKKLTVSYALFGTKYGSVDNCFRIAGEKDFVTVPNGIAHYLEHRMFTQKDGSDITERFSEYGADSNAYTTFTKTVYLFSCTENLDKSLGALIDFVTEPHFTGELVDKERGIIVEEIKMGEDNPYDRCFYGLLEAMYQNNSVRINIAGTEESVSEITADMLNACYRTFYAPNNMALVVCGDVTPEEVMFTVEQHLPSDFVSVDAERRYLDEPREVYQAQYEAYMPVAKPIFTIGVKDSVIGNAKERMARDAAMQVLCEMLFSRSGKLYNDLFESGKISPELSYGYSIVEQFAFLTIGGEADEPTEVLAYIQEFIREKQKNGLSCLDFERCKRVMLAEYIKDFDSTEEIANNMIDYIFDGGDIFDCYEALEGVTFEDVERLLHTAFDPSYFCLSVIRPDGQQKEK